MFQQPDWIHEACLLVLNGLQNAIHYVEKLVRSDPAAAQKTRPAARMETISGVEC